MRSNLPVTNREYVLQATETIVSKTDMQGNITYVNADFVRISGFSERELMGAPQNIVRHPDMPEEAFRDFWRTLHAGKAWTGIVKNRCKNGDHYWVEANAAPLIENNQVVGYTSIRGKPSREQVKAAEAAYASIKAGHSKLTVREGHAVPRARFDLAGKLGNLSISAKLFATFGAMLALFVATALLAWLAPAGAAAWTVGCGALGALLALVFGLTLHAGIVGPLQQVLHDIGAMSSGDLSGRIHTHGDDEIGGVMQSLRILQINLKLLVGQIKQSTVLVNTGAGEIAAGNLDLSGRTESQASSLEETASAMEQLTSTVKHNADNAHEASELVVATSDIAVRGGHAVDQVVQTMGSIRDSSRKIVDIISVIDGIAFQTNILALNAAVEAARAGEQGRGFAVVATEVRNLAQRSAAAAREIKELIGDSVAKVEAGGQLVDDAGHTMNEIVEAVKQAAAIMGEISASSREQSAGIEQVNQAINQMDEITQQNAALVEQAAGAAGTMQEQAVNLAHLVGAFKLVSGEAAPAPRARSAGAVRATLTTLPGSSKAAPAARKPAAPKHKVANGDDEWDEF
jgi:aerotaxis receptor